MKTIRLPSLALSILLHALPLVRSAASAEILATASPIVALLRWIGGASMAAGAFHGVSGSSIAVTNPAESRVRATNGVDVAFRVSLTYTSGSTVLSPALYEASNLPPGFNQPTKSGSIWRITGKPTTSGTFANVMLTGYQNANKSGNKATVPLTITVVDETPTITAQPVDTTVTAGQSATLSVTAIGGSLTYQWLKGDLEIPNATTASLLFASAQESDTGTYRVRIGNTGGSLLSSPAVLTVKPGVAGPKLTVTPTETIVHGGSPLSLNAVATGSGPFTWTWTRDGQALKSFTRPEGDGGLVISSVSPSDSGLYAVSVTDASGGTASAPAVRITVVAPLLLGIPTLAGGQLAFEFQAIAQRPDWVEESLPQSPPLWTPVTAEVSATGGPDPTAEVPLRIAIPEPPSGTRLYRVRAR
ncbi:MAG: immunoglobulin domain-containing protein [Limisphaerales bacterium]